MKVYILKPRRDLPEDNPWEPWYDKVFGFVVRAESEEEARKMANSRGGDETGPIWYQGYRVRVDPWLDPKFSTCEELTPEGPSEIILTDMRSA